MAKLLFPTLTLACGFALGLYASNADPLAPEARETKIVPFPEAMTDAVGVSMTGLTQGVEGDSIHALVDLIESEIERRQGLEQQLRALRGEVEALALRLSPEEAGPGLTPSAADSAMGQGMTVQRFVDAGFAYPRALEVKGRLDAIELDRLNLQHQARREGWMDTDRYTQAQAELDARVQTFREGLDETDYDRFLYATGQFNRVRVDSIMAGSTAQQTGISVGDSIMRYNGKRIYNWGELRAAIQDNTHESVVALVIQREGSPITLHVPSGPLGVRLGMARVAPQS